jgi:FAD/FMN-containing dehydrogenase/Fe-S oxidoreductase
MTQLRIIETTSSPADRDRLARDLANAVEGEVRFGLHDRMLYATDASLYQVEPLGVVIPTNADDAVRAVKFCSERGVAMLPRGGGTSLAGQCTNRAVVIDLSPNFRALGEIDPDSRTCEAGPGMTIEELNLRIVRAGHQLFFAPDPATIRQASVGGCIGNNAAGARSILFGRTSENIDALTVALANGEVMRLDAGAAQRDPRVRERTTRIVEIVSRNAALIRERFPKTVRRNAGYQLDLVLNQLDAGRTIDDLNLATMLCGSEGTLAMTLSARLKLRPIPRSKGLAVLSFESVDAAIAATLTILETRPSAVELLDDLVIDLALQNQECRRYVELLPKRGAEVPRAVLYVEYFANGGVEEIQERFEALKRAVPHAGIATYTDQKAMLSAWRLRQSGEPLLHGLPGERKPITFVEDNAIPPENLSEFVTRLRAIVEKHGTKAAFYAHASVGVLHVRPLLSTKSPEDLARLRAIAVEAADLARDLGGVMSGEHGDGRVRSPLLERFYGPEMMRAFREIKAVFDPKNLLNPGNIVEPGPIESITARLRVAPKDLDGDGKPPVRVPKVETFYEYDDQEGFDHAVEMCNGAGVCRKRSGGTMCPSYMALQDERHATRGRGNALRLAITGQLGRDGQSRSESGDRASAPNWNDRGTLETLNLCLSCKACKAECPSNVDIARLKSEYHAQRNRAHGGAPWKYRVLARVRELNALAAIAPRLNTAVSQSRPFRAVMNAVFGFDARRSLPPFTPSLFRWFKKRGGSPAAKKKVVLFGDCFSAYNESHIGKAAVGVLEALGYEVLVPRTGCCARPAISMGLLPEAIATADRTLEQLRPFVEDDAVEAILVIEPSCLSAMNDDWQILKLRAPKRLRRALAQKAMLVEDFVEKRWDLHPVRPALTSDASRVVLHGHCHQKAIVGVESSAALMRRIAGDRLEVLDTTCCGMAGMFGYTKDRFDLSMKIGELGVLPAARSVGDGEVMVAPGTSCRHQIHDGAHAKAIHPIEFAASAMGVNPDGPG